MEASIVMGKKNSQSIDIRISYPWKSACCSQERISIREFFFTGEKDIWWPEKRFVKFSLSIYWKSDRFSCLTNGRFRKILIVLNRDQRHAVMLCVVISIIILCAGFQGSEGRCANGSVSQALLRGGRDCVSKCLDTMLHSHTWGCCCKVASLGVGLRWGGRHCLGLCNDKQQHVRGEGSDRRKKKNIHVTWKCRNQ